MFTRVSRDYGIRGYSMKLPEIALFFARKKEGGGTTSFTVHLYWAMKDAGINVKLYRLSLKERAPKTIGDYANVTAHYVTPKQARYICRNVPSLLTAPENEKNLPTPDCLIQMMKAGMRIVIHDPNEFNSRGYEHLRERALVYTPFCIRPTMHRFYPNAIFIPHPYCREYEGWQGEDLFDRKLACSITRVTFVKRSHMLLEANRLLNEKYRIRFHGAENRLYTYFKLKKKFPEFKQGGYDLPLEWGVSARKAHEYMLAFDMTYFPKDGGGSQYTFMEAWDAGTVNIIHNDWLRYRNKYATEMIDGENCIAVRDAEQIKDIIFHARKNSRFRDELKRISRCSTKYLETWHDPTTIAARYLKELTGNELETPILRFPREK